MRSRGGLGRAAALAAIVVTFGAVPRPAVAAPPATAPPATAPPATAPPATAPPATAPPATAPPATAPPATRRTHVTIALRPRDPFALARYVRKVSAPGSPEYGRYLTPGAFGARFGAGSRRIDVIHAALRARGLHPGPTSAGGLSIPLTVTAAQLRAAGGANGLISRALPRAARGAVLSVIALGRSAAARPLALRATPRRGGPDPVTAPPIAPAATAPAVPRADLTPTVGPQPCGAATVNAALVGAPTDQLIAGAYDFDSLYAAGDEGAGTTVAVYELEPDDPADIAHFQACYGTHAAISYISVDGGVGQGAGSDEAALDIENLIGFDPQARLLVYQGPNAESGLPGSGPYDVFSAIVNQDRARVVSVSWGQCEQQLGIPAERAESILFEQAAVQGQSIVAAAGDNGAEDCDTGGAGSSLRRAVDDPASQPDVIGVGGTTLLSAGPPPGETVWNDGGPGGSGIGAGGGGVSARWGMGPDQLDTPAFLHVRRSAARGSVCGQPTAYCREVPDVSADADPATGYDIFWNGADTQPEPSGWQVLGGTSAAAPLWAALFALADASPACNGSPLGFAGPALYRAAAGHYAADFHDVSTGENDFTGTDDGLWAAGSGYDLASGLGTPDAGPLVASLCADSVRLAMPAGQSSAVRAAVRVAVHATDVRGATLTYAAEHLPPGVRMQARTGRLVGRPRTPGRYRVLVGVRDGRGARASRRFTWIVGGAPRVSSARLRGAGGAGELTLTVACGPHVPWLRALRIHLPAGLEPTAASHVVVRAHGGTLARVKGSVVSISLTDPSPSVRVSIPVRLSGALGPRVSVGARDGSTGTSVLRAALTAARPGVGSGS